jgi:hypothetical protein
MHKAVAYTGLTILCVGIITIVVFIIISFLNGKSILTSEIKQLKMSNKIINYERHIWTFWNTKEFPPVVKYALLSWKKTNPDFQIHLLSLANMHEYISMDELPLKFTTFSPQTQADVIRLCLLEKYGGIWCDASYWQSEAFFPEWDIFSSESNNYDLMGYYIESFTNNMKRPVVENWFLVSKPHSIVIQLWKKEFFSSLENFDSPAKYIAHLKQQNVDMQLIDNPVYLNMHAAMLKVFQDTNFDYEKQTPFQIKLKGAAEDPSGPLYHLSKKWPVPGLWNILADIKEYNNKIPPSIKIRGGERYFFDSIISMAEISHDSCMLKQFMKKVQTNHD